MKLNLSLIRRNINSCFEQRKTIHLGETSTAFDAKNFNFLTKFEILIYLNDRNLKLLDFCVVLL